MNADIYKVEYRCALFSKRVGTYHCYVKTLKVDSVETLIAVMGVTTNAG